MGEDVDVMMFTHSITLIKLVKLFPITRPMVTGTVREQG